LILVSTPRQPDETRIEIATDADIVKARQVGREMAAGAGCSATDLTMVATAISEIARNLLTHAGGGEVEMRMVNHNGRRSLEIVARDEGPGIIDIDQALEDGFTTGEGLGLGLPGAKRLMDDFAISSEPGRGTVVIMHKWCGGG
jgi:serine/threonine-protein kinase RsbT